MTSNTLLEFVRDQMTMSGPYQPLVIQALVESGGSISKRDLAQKMLVNDETQVHKAERVLMRWPLATLRSRGIIEYDRPSKTFRLAVPVTEGEISLIVSLCRARLGAWNRQNAPKQAGHFFGVIERAEGRCQACGVLGTDRALDIDHVVPQSRANARGDVKLASGEWVGVDDERNLQALCYTCNRGKQDLSATDFRPTIERLAETVVLVEQRCRRLGYNEDDLSVAIQMLRRRLGTM